MLLGNQQVWWDWWLLWLLQSLLSILIRGLQWFLMPFCFIIWTVFLFCHLILPSFLLYVCLLFLLCSHVLFNPSINCLISFCDTVNSTTSSFSIPVNRWKFSSVCTIRVYIRTLAFFSTCEMSWPYNWRDSGWAPILYNHLLYVSSGLIC